MHQDPPDPATARKLTTCLSEVETPAEAAALIDNLERAADLPLAKTTPGAEIVDIARQAAAATEAEKPALDEAVAQITGGPDEKFTDPRLRRSRRLLRRELIRRLKPFDAVDAMAFVEINHLPHPALADRFFAQFSWAMTGGAGWFVVLLGHLLWKRKAGWRTTLGVAPALWAATLTVEYPIKSYVRRQRPFLALIEAIVVGRKPGSFSFPSGHSAAAFAGAVLLSRHLPRGRGAFYFIASLVAFSRIYLGAHYPGDVVVGSAVGTFLARVYARLFSKLGFPALPPGRK